MGTAERLTGEPVAALILDAVADRVGALDVRGVTPTLGTVLASDDPVDERFMSLKHEAAEAVGVTTRGVRIDPADAAGAVVRAVERLCADPSVHAVFVQVPLPDPVDESAVRRAIDPRRDVDGFHPETLGRLVGGDPRFVPATPAAVLELLDHYEVATAGRDVVVVGRSSVIGRPLANLLWRDATPGNATVTVCHTRTRDLGAKTRGADVLVTAAGAPGLVDGSMLAPGAAVVDVSATGRPGTDAVAGDVDFESAVDVVGAITPVPGGVGAVTVATLLRNVVLAAERQAAETT